MPGYINIGNRYTNWGDINLNGKDYRTLEPKEMFLDFIKYKQNPVEWDLKKAVLIGGEGSGKTVIIRYLVYLIRNTKIYEGLVSVVRTNDIRIVGDKRYRKYFEGYKIIVLIIDDAMAGGMDSRMAMHGININMTQEIAVMRHTLEDNFGKNGVMFMIFANQVYSRIDPSIRENAQLTIVTQYYRHKWFKDLFSPEDAEPLRIATYEGLFSSNLDARRFCLAVTNTEDVALLEIPFSRKEDVPYPFINRSIEKGVVIEKLSEILLNSKDTRDFNDFTKAELKAYLKLNSKPIKEGYNIKLKEGDYISAVDRASILRKLEILKNPRRRDRNPSNKPAGERIVGLMENEKSIFTIKELDERFEEITYNNISTTLTQDTILFKKIARGTYCLKNYELTQLEREKYCQDKKLNKILIMS